MNPRQIRSKESQKVNRAAPSQSLVHEKSLKKSGIMDLAFAIVPVPA